MTPRRSRGESLEEVASSSTWLATFRASIADDPVLLGAEAFKEDGGIAPSVSAFSTSLEVDMRCAPPLAFLERLEGDPRWSGRSSLA